MAKGNPKRKKQNVVKKPLLTTLQTSEDEPDKHHLTIFSLVRNHAQIDFAHYKLSTVSRRIQRQMSLHNIESIAEYATYLESKPDAVRVLCDDVFIHVTQFFRDKSAFEALQKKVFPRIIKNRIPGAPLRIWVPGCSTGEEAYSIAITLLEYLGENSLKIPFQIFATDISEQAVQVARTGSYSERETKDLSPALLKKYFDKVKEGYRIKRNIRDYFVFSRHDLTSNPPFAKMDLISCRNVLIYFAPQLQKQVMPVFHYALNRDGYLWLGKSETPVGINKLFTLTDSSHKIFSKISTASPVTFRTPMLPSVNEDGKPKVSAPALDTSKEFDRVVISRYAPSGIVINSELEILQLRGDNSPYLALGSGQPNYSLLKLLRPELLPGVRMALQSAQKKNASVRKEGLGYEFANERRTVAVDIIPINVHLPPPERQYVILFDEAHPTTRPQSRRRKPIVSFKGKKQTGEPYVAELLAELDAMRDYQQSLAEGYEATREELTSSNEELQSTLEEFQSTNEELETAKEELQASNEELTTVNDELQKRNEELVAAIETASNAEEKFRLLIAGVKDYAIYMLEPDGTVSTWNEGAKRINGYEEGEIIGQHFSKFYPPDAVKAGHPQKELEIAKEKGTYEEEGIRIRKDGTRFFAQVLITAIHDKAGNLRGFSKVTRDISERKAAESNLTQTETRYRQMIESVRDYAIFRLDPMGNVLTWNEGARRLKGYAAEEVIGKHFSMFYPEEQIKEKLPERLLAIAQKEGKVENEGWRIRKDGSKFWADVVITRIADEEGNLLGFAKITRDLTERRRAEEALKKQALMFDTALSTSPDYYYIFDPNHRFTYVNKALLTLWGKSLEEVLGKTFEDLGYPPHLVKLHEDQLNEVLTGKTVAGENAYSNFEGKAGYYEYVFVPIFDSEGKVQAISGTTRDVTQRRKVEEARLSQEVLNARLQQAEQSEEQLRALADTIPQLAWIAKGDGYIFWYNQRWYDYTGKTQEELEGWGWKSVHDPIYLPKVEQAWEHSIKTGEPFNMEFPLRATDGSFRWFLTRIVPVLDNQGTVLRWFGTNTDIDDERRQRQSLAEALSLRDEFITIASHELKTPLTSLKLQLQMADRATDIQSNRTPTSTELKETFALALRQVNLLSNFVDDLFDTSKIQTGKFALSPEIFDLSDLVRDIAKGFSQQLKNAGISLKLNLEPVTGNWDKSRLTQVLVNLFTNAIKYAPKAPLQVSVHEQHRFASLIIQDHGPGIPKDRHEKIFERFERANANRNVAGLGLGLFIVRSIVEAHKGSVRVEGDEGEGTRFVIELPQSPNLIENGGPPNADS